MTIKHADTDHPIHDAIAHRWSPCAFADRPVATEDLQSIFEAARWSASSYNEQPWNYIVSTQAEPDAFKTMLSCLVDANQVWAKRAPVLALGVTRLTFAASGKENLAAHHDLGAASTTLQIEATIRGLHVHQMIGVLHDRVREVYGIPKEFEPLTALAIGYLAPAETLPENLQSRDKSARSRKPLREFIFSGTWDHAASLTQ